jgi:hypothetical protein
MKDLGELCYFLGIEVIQSPKGYGYYKGNMPRTNCLNMG